MKVTLTKWVDSKPVTKDFLVAEIRFSFGSRIASMNIIGLGWRTITADQYDDFTISEE